MTEYPIQSDVVKSIHYRDELNRILLDFNPTNGERVFFVCFLKDQLGWDPVAITELICKYNKWTNFNYKKTVRNINQLFEKKSKYQLTKHQSSTTTESVETWTQETQQEDNTYKKVVETRRYRDDLTKNMVPAAFQVSTDYTSCEQDTTMSRDLRSGARAAPPQTIRTISTINDGDSRYLRLTEKEGEYGGFFSLESGWLSDVEYEGKPIRVPARPDRYFTLPSDETSIRQLIAALQKLLPSEEEPVETTKPKKK